MKILYLIDTQNLFYGARMFSETSRVNYQKLIPYLKNTYGEGDCYAFVLVTDYNNSANFISLLKKLGCVVKKYYADIKNVLSKQNKLNWGEWVLQESIKLNVNRYDRIVIVSSSGIFIRLLKVLDPKIDNIVVGFESMLHSKLRDYCYTQEFIKEEFIFDTLDFDKKKLKKDKKYEKRNNQIR